MRENIDNFSLVFEGDLEDEIVSTDEVCDLVAKCKDAEDIYAFVYNAKQDIGKKNMSKLMARLAEIRDGYYINKALFVFADYDEKSNDFKQYDSSPRPHLSKEDIITLASGLDDFDRIEVFVGNCKRYNLCGDKKTYTKLLCTVVDTYYDSILKNPCIDVKVKKDNIAYFNIAYVGFSDDGKNDLLEDNKGLQTAFMERVEDAFSKLSAEGTSKGN